MAIFHTLYQLLIGPLELFFEIIFSLAKRYVSNPGTAIIVLSLVMNFLVLPLYKRADDMQAEQREVEKKLHKWETHIKKTFQGDERYMILQTYYRQNHYKPTYALRGTVSLLLEIPFFIAAYNMLSGLQLLQGVSFGPIRDLGAPDALLVIGGISINVLPILMTVINGITSAIYTKGYPLKSKIQLYGMALIFLVLLYTSPSGLVFYWTLNNLFSLVKTIFYKLKNPKRVFGFLASGAGLLLLAYTLLIHPMPTVRSKCFVLVLVVGLQLPMVLDYLARKKQRAHPVTVGAADNFIFYAGCIFLTILTGLLIPSAVIRSSPEEFINQVTFHNPLVYVGSTAVLAAGTFLVWFVIFYRLASPAGKKWMGYGILALSACGAVDYLFFGTKMGTISRFLQYINGFSFTGKEQMINLLVLVLVAAAAYFLWRKRAELVKVLYTTVILAVAVMSAINLVEINSHISGRTQALREDLHADVTIPMSRTGKNVVVLMMDRAIGAYAPYILQEHPQLQEQLAGFTYYPNTISYGAFTNFGVPAVYGGYEYTPEEMNKRDQEPLSQKQNEALKVMPHLFREQGYQVTVCDPTYANYQWIPDLSIYDEYPDINAYITMRTYDENPKAGVMQDQLLRRNLFCFSLMKIAPVMLQTNLYTNSVYNNPDLLYGAIEEDDYYISSQVIYNESQASGLKASFMSSYKVMENLPNMMEITDEPKNTFLMMSNDMTHEPMILKEPEYVPAVDVDNTEYDQAHQDRFFLDGRELKIESPDEMAHYHINTAALMQLGNWMDYLRQEGLYDNTRIIVVADHGWQCRQFEDMVFSEESGGDALTYNPLLMVKDFGSTELHLDTQFMTNADVPTLAMDGIVENPVNPFTGKAINSEPKFAPEQHIFYSTDWQTSVNHGTTFLPGIWFGLKNQNIFDADNWRKLP